MGQGAKSIPCKSLHKGCRVLNYVYMEVGERFYGVVFPVPSGGDLRPFFSARQAGPGEA